MALADQGFLKSSMIGAVPLPRLASRKRQVMHPKEGQLIPIAELRDDLALPDLEEVASLKDGPGLGFRRRPSDPLPDPPRSVYPDL